MGHEPIDEKAVFNSARRLTSTEERLAYLQQACGQDSDALRRILDLLRVYDQEKSFMESPPVVLGATVDEPVTEKPGTVIGPYKLLEQIGEGGFGVVFMAEQTEPVRRKVALKVLKPGMDTKQITARFEAERQALAIMDHPNIAKIHDGGATPSGRPYFVMELVKGVPITEFCDQNHLTPRQRLELFIPICQAVQHAHQKGIIHRDLKPTNVLVSRHDTTPIVKVIDFGVAKALGHELTDKTLFTSIAQMIGTPLYMSPEQAGMSDLDIDTRSDIYSLGVLLYELLTGTTPFDKERFKQAAYDEIRRIIREEEPPKPSTRLSESKDSLPSISVQRQTEPAKLTKLVRGELDWIVMKALEKDRNRRYETANGFVADLQRYLADEPVQACPPSAGYRLRKFARRNKAALLMASVITVALVASVAVLAISNVRISEEMDQKVEALKEKETALQSAKAQRQLALENLNKAREAVDQMLTRVAEEKLTQVPQMEPVRKALLKDALKFYQGFLEQSRSDSMLRLETALAYYRVGKIHNLLEQPAEAEGAFREAIVLLEKLVTESPSEAQYRAALAQSYHQLGHATAGDRAATEDQPERSETAGAKAVTIYEQLIAEHPSDPTYRHRLAESRRILAITLILRGRPSEAEVLLRQSLAAEETLEAQFRGQYPGRFSRGVSRAALGCICASSGRMEEAEQEFRQALRVLEQLAVDFPSSKPDYLPRVRLDFAKLVLAGTGRVAEAETLCRQAIADWEPVSANFPNVPQNHSNLAQAHLALGAVLANRKPAEAENAYARAMELWGKLTVGSPTNFHPWAWLALARRHHADLLAATDRGEEAKHAYAETIAIYDKTLWRKPDHAGLQNDFAWLLATCPDPPLREPGRAVALAKRAVELNPQVGRNWTTLGIAHYRAGDWKAAIAALEKSKQLRNGGDSFDWFFLAMAHWQLGDKEQARKWYDQAVRWMEKNKPQDEELHRFRVEAAELLQIAEPPKKKNVPTKEEKKSPS